MAFLLTMARADSVVGVDMVVVVRGPDDVGMKVLAKSGEQGGECEGARVQGTGWGRVPGKGVRCSEVEWG